MVAAAAADRVDVAALLIELGVSVDVDVSGEGTRPLHIAAAHDAAAVAALLIDRGAEVDARDTAWDATPLGWAVFAMRPRAIDLLSRASRDLFNLVFVGAAARVRDLLAEDPSLAQTTKADGRTLLMSLPDDDEQALEMVELVFAHGADPTARNADGHTAADLAARRALDAAAERLRRAASQPRGG
jgi:ankyrin repeat protein